jgi:hypothetical protein
VWSKNSNAPIFLQLWRLRASGFLLLISPRIVKKLICGHIIMETKRFFCSINGKKAHLILPFFSLAC